MLKIQMLALKNRKPKSSVHCGGTERRSLPLVGMMKKRDQLRLWAFKERDEIVLQEWDPEEKEYTGRQIEGVILYITDWDQKSGTVVFSYRPILFSE